MDKLIRKKFFGRVSMSARYCLGFSSIKNRRQVSHYIRGVSIRFFSAVFQPFSVFRREILYTPIINSLSSFAGAESTWRDLKMRLKINENCRNESSLRGQLVYCYELR